MATDRVEKSCAVRISRHTLLPCSERLLYSRQDPSTDARDDRDGFYFQRSFDLRFIGLPKIAAERDFWEEERQA